MLGEKATKAKCGGFKQRYGLDDSIPDQFVRYSANLLQGNFGTSIKDGRQITDIISERLPMTIELTFFADDLRIRIRRSTGRNVRTEPQHLDRHGYHVNCEYRRLYAGLLVGPGVSLSFRGGIKRTPFFIPPSSRLSAGVSLVPLSQTWGLENLTGVSQVLAHAGFKFCHFKWLADP